MVYRCVSGPAVLLDSSLPPPAAAHYQPVTSQPPPQTILGIDSAHTHWVTLTFDLAFR